MIREIPQPPKLKGSTHYTFAELDDFEKGEKELRLNNSTVHGYKPRGPKPAAGLSAIGKNISKEGNVEHETISEPFKPAYTMTAERSQNYLSRMHGRCAQNFGE